MYSWKRQKFRSHCYKSHLCTLRFQLYYSHYNKENVLSIHMIMFVLFHIKLNGWKNILYHDAYLLFLVGSSDPVYFSRFVSIALAYKLRSS